MQHHRRFLIRFLVNPSWFRSQGEGGGPHADNSGTFQVLRDLTSAANIDSCPPGLICNPDERNVLMYLL
jgi:hypothetical protein